jgi:hypothetical protein
MTDDQLSMMLIMKPEYKIQPVEKTTEIQQGMITCIFIL